MKPLVFSHIRSFMLSNRNYFNNNRSVLRISRWLPFKANHNNKNNFKITYILNKRNKSLHEEKYEQNLYINALYNKLTKNNSNNISLNQDSNSNHQSI